MVKTVFFFALFFFFLPNLIWGCSDPRILTLYLSDFPETKKAASSLKQSGKCYIFQMSSSINYKLPGGVLLYKCTITTSCVESCALSNIVALTLHKHKQTLLITEQVVSIAFVFKL